MDASCGITYWILPITLWAKRVTQVIGNLQNELFYDVSRWTFKIVTKYTRPMKKLLRVSIGFVLFSHFSVAGSRECPEACSFAEFRCCPNAC